MTKLQDELAAQQALQQEEESQLEMLSESLTLYEQQLSECEETLADVNERREREELSIVELRAQVEMLTSKKHELALKKQQLDNHQKTLGLQQFHHNL